MAKKKPEKKPEEYGELVITREYEVDISPAEYKKFMKMIDEGREIEVTREILGMLNGCCAKGVKGDNCKKCTGEKKKTVAVAAAKKQKTGGVLTKGEMAKIKSLRKEGMPIKAIGKTIRRGEKVVANYVHELEKTQKRK